MSISSEISRLGGNISDALDAVDDMGGTVPNGATSDDLAAAILSIPQSGGGVASDVFWVDVLLDLQTMSISSISHTYSEILAAYNAGKIIKTRSTYYISVSEYEQTIGELRTYLITQNAFTFDMIVYTNIGSGWMPVYFLVYLDDGNQTSMQIIPLGATS